MFLILYFCCLDVGVEVKRGGERSREEMRGKAGGRDEGRTGGSGKMGLAGDVG